MTFSTGYMDTNASPYVPIACEFHDRLEDIAITQKLARISFLDVTGVVSHRTTSIADVYAREGTEYLATGSGETFRLDRILEVDGERLPSD
jgi:Rho-binding antiterminator